MSTPLKFDDEKLAKEAIASSPEVTMNAEQATAKLKTELPPLPAEVTAADETDGQAVAYSLNAAHHEFLKEDLNQPLVDAVGRVMAGVFSQMRASGASPNTRLIILGLGIMPAVAVVGLRFWQKVKQGPEKA